MCVNNVYQCVSVCICVYLCMCVCRIYHQRASISNAVNSTSKEKLIITLNHNTRDCHMASQTTQSVTRDFAP